MNISIGPYKVRVEILVALVVIFWIMFGHLLCGCCRMNLFEGFRERINIPQLNVIKKKEAEAEREREAQARLDYLQKLEAKLMLAQEYRLQSEVAAEESKLVAGESRRQSEIAIEEAKAEEAKALALESAAETARIQEMAATEETNNFREKIKKS
jgi:hypothetical protein